MQQTLTQYNTIGICRPASPADLKTSVQLTNCQQTGCHSKTSTSLHAAAAAACTRHTARMHTHKPLKAAC